MKRLTLLIILVVIFLTVQGVASHSGEAIVEPGWQRSDSVSVASGEEIGTSLTPGWKIDSLYESPVSPQLLRIGPNDEILITDDIHPQIFEVQENGDLSVWYSDPDTFVDNFDFDPDGTLWIYDGGYYRVDANGAKELISQGGLPNFRINSHGIMYAAADLTNYVQRTAPEGQVTRLAEGFGEARHLVIGPNDEVLIVEQSRAELIQVFDDGTWTVIIGGFQWDSTVAVSPDGTVYLVHLWSLEIVDIATGEITPVGDWVDPYLHKGNEADFDSMGRMYIYHPNSPVLRLDPQARTGESIYHPRSNTWALAVSPDGRVFNAYDYRIPHSETTLFEITDGGQLVEILSVPYNSVHDLDFGPDGTGYLSVGQPNDIDYGAPGYWASRIYAIDLTSRQTEIFYDDPYGSSLILDVDPTTGFVWWLEGPWLKYKDIDGQIISVAYPHSNPQHESDARIHRLVFGPDGSLYALITLDGMFDYIWGMDKLLYQRKPDGTWHELNAPEGLDINVLSPVVCTDGRLYLLGALHSGEFDIFPVIYEFLDNESLLLHARDIFTDTFSADCDPLSGDIYYGHYHGVARFFQWATDFQYLPAITH